MNEAQVYERLTELMRDVLMKGDLVLSSELKAGDVDGWDSFKMIEIIVAVENQFGIQVRSKELDVLEKVGDLVKLIMARQRPAVLIAP